MGHEIPAGLGIRLHEGDGPEVIVVIGDGTYLMSPTELVTAAQEGWKVTVVVLDNGGYGSIDTLARTQTGASIGNERRRRGRDGRLPDGEIVPVDFAANARSMGCAGVRVDTLDGLRDALAAARAGSAPTVIVCPIADRPLPGSGAFWDLGVPEVAARAETQALADAHRERALAQRHY
jgi:3D-(3,5/4)-trihydroxycyclohexane-1,2-dione acylhydrolase (decyclizing)